ncbi:MAG: hypothetical protein KDJ37_12490 [Hyphomicrobiaceae bacterium]|nr:hypothetical protein [Hyphomicrobiaceae bacterium]
MTVTRVGSAQTIATVNQDFFTDEGNDLIRLPNGNFAFAFVSGDIDMSIEFGTLRSMTLDGFGEALSGITILQQDYEGYLSQVELQHSLNGDYFAIWSDESNAGPDGDGLGMILDGSSTPLTPSFGISNVTAATDFEFAHAITRLGDGNYLATWSDANGTTVGASLDLDIRAQVFAADGTRLGAEFTLNATAADQQLMADSVRLTGGQEVVVWQTGNLVLDGMGNPTGIDAVSLNARFVDAGGTPLGTDITLHTLAAGWDYTGFDQISVANIAGGGFAVGLAETNLADASVAVTNKTFTVKLQRYDSNGNAVGGAITVHEYTGIDVTNDDEFINALDIVELPNGGVVVYWTTYDAQTFTSTANIEAFDAAGNVIVPETDLTTLPGFGNLGYVVSVEALANNQLLVVGSTSDGMGNITYSSQIVDLGLSGFNILNGSPNSDPMLIGTSGNDYISGITGDDFINGGSGADLVRGGEGRDLIQASADFDTIDGGADIDTFDLSSSTGVVNWVNLDAAGSQFRVDSGAGFVARATLANIENVSDSAGSDRFYGNAADNTYSYSAGFDTFDGNGGIDTLDISAMTAGFQWIDLQAASSQLRSNDGSGWVANMVVSDVERFVTNNTTDHFRGSAGDETVVYVGGRDFIDGRAGSDTLDMSNFDLGTWVNLNIAFDQFRFHNGAGFASGGNMTGVENVIGSDGNDYFYADANNNTYFGGLGNDRFEGGLGDDTFLLDGTLGDYTVAQSGANYVVNGISGTDTLVGVEFVTLGGTTYDIATLDGLI